MAMGADPAVCTYICSGTVLSRGGISVGHGPAGLVTILAQITHLLMFSRGALLGAGESGYRKMVDALCSWVSRPGSRPRAITPGTCLAWLEVDKFHVCCVLL